MVQDNESVDSFAKTLYIELILRNVLLQHIQSCCLIRNRFLDPINLMGRLEESFRIDITEWNLSEMIEIPNSCPAYLGQYIYTLDYPSFRSCLSV